MKKSFLALATVAVFFLSSCTVGVVATHPPYAREEIVGVAPGPDYVWVGREYAWRNGAYVEVPGYWARRAYANAVWTPGHWHRNGESAYRWVPGHWD